MTPERRAKFIRSIMRVSNVVPCAHHVDPRVLEADLASQTDEQLTATLQTLELILDEALGTDA